MLKIKEVLEIKGDILFTATPEQTVDTAVEIMADHNIGSLVIMEYGRLTGLLTFKEVLKCLADPDKNFRETTIRSIMNDAPITVSPDTEADEVSRLLLEHHARYIPVMDGPILMGVISFVDMAKATIEQSEFEKDLLKAYIKDWPAKPNKKP